MPSFLELIERIADGTDPALRADVESCAGAAQEINLATPDGYVEGLAILRRVMAFALTVPLNNEQRQWIVESLRETGYLVDATQVVNLCSVTASYSGFGTHLGNSDHDGTWIPDALLTWFDRAARDRLAITGSMRWRISPEFPIPIKQRLVLAQGWFDSRFGMAVDARRPIFCDTFEALRQGMEQWAKPWRREGAGIHEILETAQIDLAGCIGWLTNVRRDPLDGWRQAADVLGIPREPGFTLEVLRALDEGATHQRVPLYERWLTTAFETETDIRTPVAVRA